jgi:hypothetical protein
LASDNVTTTDAVRQISSAALRQAKFDAIRRLAGWSTLPDPQNRTVRPGALITAFRVRRGRALTDVLAIRESTSLCG